VKQRLKYKERKTKEGKWSTRKKINTKNKGRKAETKERKKDIKKEDERQE
jgi:hypothetical protein